MSVPERGVFEIAGQKAQRIFRKSMHLPGLVKNDYSGYTYAL
jgi:hypothetical protein